MPLNSMNKILDFAIGKEEEAAQLYSDLAAKMAPAHMKKVFESFAEEEKLHKAKLLTVRGGERPMSVKRKIEDLKIADYLPDVDPGPDLNYQQALIIAMKAEKAAFKLYSDLADSTDDGSLKQMFQMLAQEEARHKLRFELEYDENILLEN